MTIPSRHDLYLTFFRLVDGQLEGAEIRRLNEDLLGNPEALRCLGEFLLLQVAMGTPITSALQQNDLPDDSKAVKDFLARIHEDALAEGLGCTDTSIHWEQAQRPLEASPLGAFGYDLRPLLHMERMAPAIPVQTLAERGPRTVPSDAKPTPASQWAMRFWLTLSVVAASILLSVLAVSLLMPRPSECMATIADMDDVQWADPQASLSRGSRLAIGSEPLVLSRGLLRLRFDNGTDVVLEGPSSFRLDQAHAMTLSTGRLCAKVPPAAMGFRVDTPFCSVIDLSTEFGLDVSDLGNTRVQMYTGKAALLNPEHNDPNQVETLVQGQACDVNKTGAIERVAPQEDLLVRYFSSATGLRLRSLHLDLADIVGGGSGFGTGRIDQGWDPATGESIAYLSATHLGARRVNSQYRPLLASDFIDGVFVPDAGEGPVVVSTTGLVFRECPDTCGKYYRGIFNGAKIGPENPESPNGQAALRGQEYGIPGHPAINLHANAGITFDLSKVREAFPGVQVERFRALCGISETLKSFHVGLIEVNCYVLVDGQIAFSSLRMRGDSEAVDIDIPLNSENRFLTLVATDTDGKGVGFHWSLFAKPVLDLAVE